MYYRVEVFGPATAGGMVRAVSEKFKDFQYIGGRAVAAKMDANSVRQARKLVNALNEDLELGLRIKVTTC